MIKYSQIEQTQILERAVILTAAIEQAEEALVKQKSMSFKNLPPEPEKKIATRRTAKRKANNLKYPIGNRNIDEVINERCRHVRYERAKPEVSYLSFLQDKFKKLNIVFQVIILVLCIFFACAPLLLVITYFGMYVPKYKKSPEHLKAIEDAQARYNQKLEDTKARVYKEFDDIRNEDNRLDEEFAREQQIYDEEYKLEQEKYDEEYRIEKEKYDNVTIPEYNSEKALWEFRNEKNIEIITEDMILNKQALDTLYNETKLISVHFRELETLIWIYNDMTSSDHDIVYSTDLFYKDKFANKLDEINQTIRNQVGMLRKDMNNRLNALNNAVNYGNVVNEELLHAMDVSNISLNKIRRGINAGVFVGALNLFK